MQLLGLSSLGNSFEGLDNKNCENRQTLCVCASVLMFDQTYVVVVFIKIIVKLTSYARCNFYFSIIILGACDHSVCLYSLVYDKSKEDKNQRLYMIYFLIVKICGKHFLTNYSKNC